jgi:hypothetical protein
VKSIENSTNASSETDDMQMSEAILIERRRHPRGTFIESLTDITYRVLREYERAA